MCQTSLDAAPQSDHGPQKVLLLLDSSIHPSYRFTLYTHKQWRRGNSTVLSQNFTLSGIIPTLSSHTTLLQPGLLPDGRRDALCESEK